MCIRDRFISTIIGVISSGNSIPYILKYIICLFIFMIISNKIKNINSYLKLSFIGAFIIFPISLGQVILSNKYLYDILLCSMEAIITFISIYIFSFGINPVSYTHLSKRTNNCRNYTFIPYTMCSIIRFNTIYEWYTSRYGKTNDTSYCISCRYDI